MAAPPIKPVRRVVTGNDENGESHVLYDKAASNVHPGAIRAGTFMTDVWVYPPCPVELSRTRGEGRLTFNFELPEDGGHLRVVQWPTKEPGYNPAQGPTAVLMGAPRQRERGCWDTGGANVLSSVRTKSQNLLTTAVRSRVSAC